MYGLDLRQYLPIFYIYGRPYEDYLRYSPEKVHKNEDGTLSLVTNEFRFRCTMENGHSLPLITIELPQTLKYFSVFLCSSSPKSFASLPSPLIYRLTCMRKSQVLKPLAGMMEDEAQIVFSKFKEAGGNFFCNNIKFKLLISCDFRTFNTGIQESCANSKPPELKGDYLFGIL